MISYREKQARKEDKEDDFLRESEQLLYINLFKLSARTNSIKNNLFYVPIVLLFTLIYGLLKLIDIHIENPQCYSKYDLK